MHVILKAILTSSLSILAAGFFTPAAAQDSNSWILRPLTYTTTGLGVKYEYRNRPTQIEVLYSSSAKAGDVAFVCASGQLMTRVTVQPGDVYDIILDNISNAYEFSGNSRRSFRPVMTVNGEKTPKIKWYEGREDRVVTPLEYKASAILYNSVVKGDKVQLKRKKKFDLELNLPPANDDFQSFGSECGIGKYK